MVDKKREIIVPESLPSTLGEHTVDLGRIQKYILEEFREKGNSRTNVIIPVSINDALSPETLREYEKQGSLKGIAVKIHPSLTNTLETMEYNENCFDRSMLGLNKIKITDDFMKIKGALKKIYEKPTAAYMDSPEMIQFRNHYDIPLVGKGPTVHGLVGLSLHLSPQNSIVAVDGDITPQTFTDFLFLSLLYTTSHSRVDFIKPYYFRKMETEDGISPGGRVQRLFMKPFTEALKETSGINIDANKVFHFRSEINYLMAGEFGAKPDILWDMLFFPGYQLESGMVDGIYDARYIDKKKFIVAQADFGEYDHAHQSLENGLYPMTKELVKVMHFQDFKKSKQVINRVKDGKEITAKQFLAYLKDEKRHSALMKAYRSKVRDTITNYDVLFEVNPIKGLTYSPRDEFDIADVLARAIVDGREELMATLDQRIKSGDNYSFNLQTALSTWAELTKKGSGCLNDLVWAVNKYDPIISGTIFGERAEGNEHMYVKE